MISFENVFRIFKLTVLSLMRSSSQGMKISLNVYTCRHFNAVPSLRNCLRSKLSVDAWWRCQRLRCSCETHTNSSSILNMSPPRREKPKPFLFQDYVSASTVLAFRWVKRHVVASCCYLRRCHQVEIDRHDTHTHRSDVSGNEFKRVTTQMLVSIDIFASPSRWVREHSARQSHHWRHR